MYTIAKEQVTKVKIDPEQWKKPAIQEVAYNFTGVIRLMMMFRCAVLIFGLSLQSYQEKRTLCYINVVFDGYFMYRLISTLFFENNRIVVRHQNSGPPLVITASLMLAGVLVVIFA